MNATLPHVWRPDWEAFHEHMERLRLEHERRTPAEAAARSLEAFARWGVAPPASFLDQHPEAVTARPVVFSCRHTRNAHR